MKKNYFMPFLSPKKYKKALLVGLLACLWGIHPYLFRRRNFQFLNKVIP